MGNSVEKSRVERSKSDSQTTPPVRHSRRFRGTRNSEKFSGFNFSNIVRNLNASSFGSFGRLRSSQCADSINRPWSRISRRHWSQRTITDPLVSSKTAWPVSVKESLFLPEFKIKNNISEESFALLGNISTGAFGKVYKVLKKDSNEIYAMKILSKCKIIATNSVKQVKDEVRIQQVVGHHPFIVNCPYFWQSKKKLYIVSEFISGGELLRLIKDHGPLDINIIKIYVSELAIALDFLHNAGIIYRDLKLENILLDSENHIQIIDFGLSKWLKYGCRTNTLCGTLQYIAPEILNREPYGHAADWWSLGIVFYCMLAGKQAISHGTDGCRLGVREVLRHGQVASAAFVYFEEVRRNLDACPDHFYSPSIFQKCQLPDPMKIIVDISVRTPAPWKRAAGYANCPKSNATTMPATSSSDFLLWTLCDASDLFTPYDERRSSRDSTWTRFERSQFPCDRKHKIQVRHRPFILEDPKPKEERSVHCFPDDRYCRICFDDRKKEIPVTACRCKGTIGLVHMTCLEKWLAMSNTHSCELCGYQYQTIRTPRYRVLYSIYYWVFLDRNPQYHRGLKSDFIVFVVLTPIAFIGVYSCIVAADFYSKEPHKYSPASRWTTISLLIMVVLLTFAYYLWVAVTIRFHMRIWYIWWQANNVVKVVARDSTEEETSSPAEEVSVESARHPDTEADATAADPETQLVISEYSA